jgi:hypothetical protein
VNRVVGGLIALLGVSTAFASMPPGPNGPIGETFARIRFAESILTLERPVEGDVQQAFANCPVAPGDVVSTRDGRAEVELADSSSVFLDVHTRVEFRALTDASNTQENSTVLLLEAGAMRLDVGDSAAGEGSFEVDTAAGSIYLLSAGAFRIEVRDGQTTLVSYRGAAELSGDEGSVLVRSGQRSVVQSERAPSEPRRWLASASDALDQFHAQRLDDEATSEAGGATVQGELPEEIRPYASELSVYGAWSTMPGFGRVWKPECAATWSPYARGYWSWHPVGWIWISSEPWGWAPYHYGRWEYLSSQGWFWIPGSVWGGAWVAFAIGTAQVGWCPLNYWDRPVVLEGADIGRRTLSAGILDVRSWQFVPVEQFGARGTDRPYLRSDRLPRTMDVAITRTLPSMHRSVSEGQGAALAWLERARGALTTLPEPAVTGAGSVSFRVLERQRVSMRPRGIGRADGAIVTHGTSPRPAAPKPPQRIVAPAYAGTEPPTSGRPRDRAVDRLIVGTRPPATPPPPPNPQVGDRPEAPHSPSPRPQPKSAPRQPHPPDDAPKPPPDDQHDK